MIDNVAVGYEHKQLKLAISTSKCLICQCSEFGSVVAGPAFGFFVVVERMTKAPLTSLAS